MLKAACKTVKKKCKPYEAIQNEKISLSLDPLVSRLLQDTKDKEYIIFGVTKLGNIHTNFRNNRACGAAVKANAIFLNLCFVMLRSAWKW